jgi:hypothetical protein
MAAKNVNSATSAFRLGPCPRTDHIESYFVRASEPGGGRGVWLRFTAEASARHDARRAAVWAFAFDRKDGHVAAKEIHPFETARFSHETLAVDVGRAHLDAHGTRGESQAGRRTLRWDLAFETRASPLEHFRYGFMYGRSFPTSKLTSPAPDVRVSGTVEVNGAPWEVSAWPGLVGHNWGRRHTREYGWGHCNSWDEEPSLVLEGFTARLGGVAAPVFAPLAPFVSPHVTLICVRHREVRYELNAVADLVRARGEVTPRRWKFSGRSPMLDVDGEIWAATEDLVGVHYEDPDGRVLHCLHSELAHARVELRIRGLSPIIAHSRAAALELVTRDTHHGVDMVL